MQYIVSDIKAFIETIFWKGVVWYYIKYEGFMNVCIREGLRYGY